MLSFSWDTAYEANPGNGISRGSIDDSIRKMGRGIAERMSVEHNFSYRNDEDDGSHIPGETTVALKDTAGVRDALTDMQDGAVYVADDGAGNTAVFVYTVGIGWEEFTDNDHVSLENLDGIGHNDVYFLRTDDIIVTDKSLDMGGNVLAVGGDVTRLIRAKDHINEIHDVTSAAAFADGHLSSYELKDIFVGTIEGSISPGQTKRVGFGFPLVAIVSINLYSDGLNIFLGCTTDSGNDNRNISIYNGSIISAYYYKLELGFVPE